jgi:hypothetical protein
MLSLMDNGRTSPLERAFQLAKSGKYATVDDIKTQLGKEGYSDSQVTGRQLTQQLRALIVAAQDGVPKTAKA